MATGMSFSHLFHFGQYVVFCRLPPLVSTKYRTKSLLFKLIFTDKFSDFSFFIFTFATIFNHYKVLIQNVKFNIYIFFTLLQTYKRINRTLST